MKKVLFTAIAAVSLISSAHAANLVKNGNFEDTTAGIGQMNYNTVVTDWATTGYNFVMDDNIDTTGVQGQYGFLALWGPGNGSSNGLSASPEGGKFLGADGAYGVAGISQLITGLVVGKTYNVVFDWAGAQQLGYDGNNTEQWEVQLGSQHAYTSVYHNTSHGFSGWKHAGVSFVATSPIDFLTFVAHGTPNGVPPFSLLDGVSMTVAPEPAAWAMMIAGFGAVGMMMRRRQKQVAPLSAG
jgi:hypothetical protein